MFSTFVPIQNGQKLFMGNSATSDIEGKGNVVLKMTSGRNLTLKDVLYVPEIRKNLVSESLLDRHGFRLVIESGKLVLTKSGIYVGKGYECGGMYKLNVMDVKPIINKNSSSSAYMLKFFNVWHAELGNRPVRKNTPCQPCRACTLLI